MSVTVDTIPILKSFWSRSFSAIVTPFVTRSTPMPMTPLWVLKPEERLVAVLAESGQKDVESCVYWIPTTGNCVNVSLSSSILPGSLTPPNTCAAFVCGDDIPSPMNMKMYFGLASLVYSSTASFVSVVPCAKRLREMRRTERTVNALLVFIISSDIFSSGISILILHSSCPFVFLSKRLILSLLLSLCF